MAITKPDRLPAEALEARRAYQREWRKTHPDRIRANALRFWMKKAEQMQAAQPKPESEAEHEA